MVLKCMKIIHRQAKQYSFRIGAIIVPKSDQDLYKKNKPFATTAEVDIYGILYLKSCEILLST